MPSPKDGTAGTIVPPAAPTAALDADDADPGQVESVKAGRRQTQTGKYGSVSITPHKKPETSETPEEQEQKPNWVEVVLKDEDGKPVPGAKYSITLPDQSVAEGTLDEKGMARVEGVDPGNCQISFPDLHPDVWSA